MRGRSINYSDLYGMELALLDKIKRLVIMSLVSEDELMEVLVLKGGNAISIAHGVGNRGSADIDFSMEDNFADVDATFEKIEAALIHLFAEEGLHVFDVRWELRPSNLSDELKAFWGGYSLEFKIAEAAKARQYRGRADRFHTQALALDERQSKIFSVDISPYEYCAPKMEMSLQGYTYYVYPPQLVVFEKVRAICQQLPQYREVVNSHTSRARARDFYDIYELMQHFPIDCTSPASKEMIRRVFAAKRVPEQYLQHMGDQRELHRTDYPSVVANVTSSAVLLDFDTYFDYVVTTFSSVLLPPNPKG